MISLLNTDMKIVSKLLLTRFKDISPLPISSNETA